MRRVPAVLFSAAVAAGVVSTLCADVTIDETTVVKTGSETAEIAAAEIGARSVCVEAGTLRVVQSENTTARYVRFTVREKNPWRTQNASDLTQMDSFELVLDGALVAWPGRG